MNSHAPWNRLRRMLCDRDDGFTLAEMLVAMTILAVVLSAAFAAILALWDNTSATADRASSVTQARLAVEQIDRQVRSGNVVYAPALEGDPYRELRIYTQANAAQKCVQWRLSSGSLQMRSWRPSWTPGDAVSDWTTVATGVVNSNAEHPFDLAPGSDPSATPDPTTGRYSGSNLVVVDLFVQTGTAGVPVEVSDSFYGRNSQFGYDTSVCSTTPP